jgi:hypothetical protein
MTVPSAGSHAPPAVTHARLLTARLLRRTALASWTSIAGVIGGDANHISENNRRYQAALDRRPDLAAELEQLTRAIENWQTPAPIAPTTPQHERMRNVAVAIKAHAGELLAGFHGEDGARWASVALCRQHTDLTCYEIAAIHDVADAQPSYSKDVVTRYRREDPDYDRRYQKLVALATELQRGAGYANANLRRGLTTNAVAAYAEAPATGNKAPNWNVR